MDFLERTYFYDKYMNKDELVSIAGNCYEQLYAVIMKNILKYDINYYTVFFKDITFYTRIDHENNLLRSAIKNNISIKKDICTYTNIVIKNNADKAIGLMNDFLKKKGYVMFRTVDDLLPFTVYYNPDFQDMKEFIEDGHVMLMIGRDEKYYYFIDQLTELNINKLEHPKKRIDIGKYEIKEFEKVFGKCLIIKDISFQNINVSKFECFTEDIIRASVNRYFNNIVVAAENIINNTYNASNNDKKFSIKGGREALIWICNFCMDDTKRLSDKVYSTVKHQITMFDAFWEIKNGMTGIVNSRKIMLGYIKSNMPFLINLSKNLEQNIICWENLRNIIIKNYYNKEYTMGSKYHDYCKNIIEYEDKVFCELKERYI